MRPPNRKIGQAVKIMCLECDGTGEDPIHEKEKCLSCDGSGRVEGIVQKGNS